MWAYIAGGAALVAVIGLIIWLVRRRKNRDDEYEEEWYETPQEFLRRFIPFFLVFVISIFTSSDKPDDEADYSNKRCSACDVSPHRYAACFRSFIENR